MMSQTKFAKFYYDNLRLACELGNVNQVKDYLQKGLDINHKNREGESALSTAITYNKLSVLKLLLENNVIIPEKAQLTSRKKESFLSVLFYSNNKTDALNLLYKYQPDSPALADKYLFTLIRSSVAKNQTTLYQSALYHLKDKEKYLDSVIQMLELNYHHYYPQYVPEVLNLTDLLLTVLIDNKIHPDIAHCHRRLNQLAEKHNTPVSQKLAQLEQMYLLAQVSDNQAPNIAKVKLKI